MVREAAFVCCSSYWPQREEGKEKRNALFQGRLHDTVFVDVTA